MPRGALLAAALALCGGLTAAASGCAGHTPASARDASADTPDLGMPDLTPDLASYGATLLLADVSGNFPVLTDGGATRLPARVVRPTLSFAPGPPVHPNIASCVAAYYDADAGTPPPVDENAGTVTFDKLAPSSAYVPFTGDGGALSPSTISCARTPLGPGPGRYTCGYGPLVDGGAGPRDPSTTLLLPSSSPIPTGAAIEFTYSGGEHYGKLDTTDFATNRFTLTPLEDLDHIRYSTTGDTVLHYICPGGTFNADAGTSDCGTEIVLLTLWLTDATPGAPGYPGPRYGRVDCANFSSSGTVTVTREALLRALGPSGHAAGVATQLVIEYLPSGGFLGMPDTNGVSALVDTGRGVIGYSTFSM